MHSRARRRGPRETGAGTLAGRMAALPVLLLVLVLLLSRAPVFDVAKFGLYVVVAVLLPGLVIWRLVGAYRRNLVEDFAAGFAIGTAAQLIVYLAASSVGLQRWAWGWAPIVLVLGVLDRDVRNRVWRRVEAPLAPLTAWLTSLATALVLFAIYRNGPERYAPAYTDPSVSDPGMAFHQALAASAKADVPVVPLWLGGEPMKFHTFFHQLTAATSWATGVELTQLIYTLVWLPFALAGCGLVFAVMQRFVQPGESAAAVWAGPLAILVAGLGGALEPLKDLSIGGVSMVSGAYLSPTQNLGLMFALVLAVLAIDLLRKQPPRSRWLLLLLVALAAAGAKATVLPMAVCGFLLVFLFRRSTRNAFFGVVIALGLFVGSVVVVFGGESSGLQVKFGDLFTQLPPYESIRAAVESDQRAELISAVVILAAWGLAVAGVLFLRRFWRDAGGIYVAGFAIGGFVAALVTSQPLSFYRMAFPFLAVLSCVGLARLVERLDDRRSAVLVAVAAWLGLIGCGFARWSSAELQGVKEPLIWTVAALLVVGLVVAAGWKAGRRKGGLATAFCAAVVTAGMVGAMTLPLFGLVSEQAGDIAYGRPARGGPTEAQADAARWLKENTPREDLIATNAHCIAQSGESCDSRHFWIAALSERQVLIEGWVRTNRSSRISATTGIEPSQVPYWNKEQLAANDATFTSPSVAIIARLRKLGVRWLYADNLAGEISPELKQYVRLRHATLDATIYEIR
ncbi:hypothetical protein [Kribbella sp. CA-293567]|uniref:hypothetical protein n=1 Tax=Kribbella sp. CA-293567 TaxID=3002436 RepID=UPI0022DE6AEF|nr:hypothetical protein [Kribbella sp. CA-293567]WBQ04951.1 hypothetical protein OX958_33985 [Kribbella sp. CA-293567]